VHDSETLYLRLRAPQFYPDRLRKAVNYAINREELWKYAAKGNAYNLGGFIPPEAYGHDPDLEPYVYDTEKARLLLSEAGYPDGFDVEMITLEAWKLECQIMSKMLERIGLKVELHVYTMPELLKRFYLPLLDGPPEQQEWDIMIGFAANTSGHTATSFLSFFPEESQWRWADVDPICDGMWKAIIGSPDVEAQEEKVRQMARYVYDKAYSPFIYSPLTLYAVNKDVDFVPQEFHYLRFKETSVTENHWSIRGQSE
jgi:ABC-type transport system substrate-binding protein